MDFAKFMSSGMGRILRIMAGLVLVALGIFFANGTLGLILIIVGGLFTVGTIRKETNPKLELNMIQVRVPYLGAAPQEVEEGVVIKIEEAIQDGHHPTDPAPQHRRQLRFLLGERTPNWTLRDRRTTRPRR